MKCGRCSELVHGPKNDAVCCQDDARSARVESSLSQWLAINAAYVRTLACVGTQLKDCGNELQLLLPLVPVLLPPTHWAFIWSLVQLRPVASGTAKCITITTYLRCGRQQGPSIMPQRIFPLSISRRQLLHNGTTVRMKSVRCARLALSGSQPTHLPIYLCTRVTSVVSCTKCPQVWSHCLPLLLCPSPASLSTLITLLCDVFNKKISFAAARA